jgi:cysteine synthase A
VQWLAQAGRAGDRSIQRLDGDFRSVLRPHAWLAVHRGDAGHHLQEKIAQIAFYGGQSHLVQDPTQIYAESERLARESGGHFMDQFTYAERATDWRANNNIAESIFQQMRFEQYPEPSWLISSPGTGGTTATPGRYVRYRQHCTRVLCADAERSVFFDFYQSGDASLRLDCGSRIEGIGRPAGGGVVLPKVIDAMVKVPDALSLAAMHYLAERLGRHVGGSSGPT